MGAVLRVRRALSYAWTAVTRPPGSEQLPPGVLSDLIGSGASAVFDTATAGDYTLQVKVSDPAGHSASLSFPIHVLAGSACKGRQQLAGYVLPAFHKAPLVGPVPQADAITLEVGLQIRDPKGLNSFIADVSDPASANYRHYLTPAQFAATYGPTPTDYSALDSWAAASGLITSGYSNRLLLNVSGTVGDVERALHVNLNQYERPDGSIFYAPDREPSLDSSTTVLRISGLDNYVVPTPRAGSGPGGSFIGPDFRSAYASCTSLTGTGQSVGLVAFDGFTASDITTYEALAGVPNVPVETVLLDGFSGNVQGGGNREVTRTSTFTPPGSICSITTRLTRRPRGSTRAATLPCRATRS
jgi:kumamolisin